MFRLIHRVMVLIGVLVVVVACNQNNVNAMESNNPFFFSDPNGSKAYQGEFLFADLSYDKLQRRVIVSSKEIGELSKGKVYEIEMKVNEDIPSERLQLGYFYVQVDRIYKCDANKDNLKWIKEKKTFPKDSEIVCQSKPLKDKLKEEEKGWHHYIEVKGDTRIYHAYNNMVETGYYESFTWKKGEGLVAYWSGFGAERDGIELAIDRTVNIVNMKDSLLYSNKKYGFYIQFPESWRGKYLMAEQDHMIALYHIDQEGIDDMCCYIIYILDSEEDWEDWGKDMIQLGRNKGHIYVAGLGNGDYPFDMTTEEGMKKAKEMDKLYRDFDLEECFGFID